MVEIVEMVNKTQRNALMMSRPWTRRRFLAAGAAAGAACCWPLRAAWSMTTRAPHLKIAFFTDVHARTEWNTPAALDMAAKAINSEKPDLVIAGGDLITDGFESAPAQVQPRWETYFEHLHSKISAPIEAAIGNHDLVAAHPKDGSPPLADPREPFLKYLKLERTWRSMDFRGVHFVFLDAIRIGGSQYEYEGWLDEAQLQWLNEDLMAAGDKTPCVVVSHMPLLTGFYQATQGGCAAAPANRIIQNAHDVLKTFEGKNVAAVLQGHLHVSEMLRWRRVTFITGGAVCGKWWRGEWHGTREGFGIVTLEGYHVEWRYIEYGWQAQRSAGV
jgi:Icc protein